MSYPSTIKRRRAEERRNITQPRNIIARAPGKRYNRDMPTEAQPAVSRYKRLAAENGASPLKNARHELFAQLLAQGKPASVAYEEVGYSYNEGNAVRLKSHEKVKARIAHLQARTAEKITTAVAIDKVWVLQKAVAGYEISAANIIDENGAFVGAAANAASRFLGQAGGHVDVQAWKDTRDINVSITVDRAISRLAQLDAPAIEGEYEVVEE